MKWLCLLRDHRWNGRSLACEWCGRTQQEIVQGRISTADLVSSAAYWKGVAAGQEIKLRERSEEERDLRLAYERGAESVLGAIRSVFDREESRSLKDLARVTRDAA